MNDFTPEKYINKVLSLYPATDREETKLHAGTAMLVEAFGNYHWSDIERALEWYYQNRNDKTRPTIAALKDVMRTIGVLDVDGNADADPCPFPRPKTRLWAIRDDFDRLVDILLDAGVIPDTDGQCHNNRSIVDPVTDMPVLNPIQWLERKLADAEQSRPDLFVRFPGANRLERLAIALGNHVITFKIRDWARHAADVRAHNGGVMPREAVMASLGVH